MTNPSPHRWRKRALLTLGILILLVGAVVLAFVLSPRPGALTVRWVFDRDAVKVTEALEKHAPDGVDSIKDQQYRADDDDAYLDVYFPAATTTALPTVIWTHGGAWISGSKSNYAPYYELLALPLDESAPLPRFAPSVRQPVPPARSDAGRGNFSQSWGDQTMGGGCTQVGQPGLKETGAPFAGEMSGHIFFAERWYGFDDATYTAGRLLEILSKVADPSAVVADVVDALKHGSKVHDSLFWQPAEPVEGMLTDPAPAAYYVRVAGIAPAVVEAIYGYGRVVDERYEGCAYFVERADEKALAEAARKVEAVGGSVKLVLKRLPEEN